MQNVPMANHCAVKECSNGSYRLKKWKKQHNNEDEPPFRLFPFPTSKKNSEKKIKMDKKYKSFGCSLLVLGINYFNLGIMQGFAVSTF